MVLLVRAADLRRPRLAVPSARQLWSGDHGFDPDRAPPDLPDRAEAIRLFRGDAGAAAQNEGAAGSLQGRQAATSAGDAEPLQAGEGESSRGLPADPDSDPDLLRTVQGAA